MDLMADDLDVLESYGLPVKKLASLIRTVRALAGGALEDLAAVVSPVNGRQGRPAGKRGPGRPRGSVRVGRPRKPRGTFKVTKDELAAMRSQGMTGKAIAQKHGVSLATVQNRLRSFGLTSGKRGRPAKKK
jgi:DNA-binding NarL/FixJ family response regulator